jgi:tetratricopeptide (TPR) repeat protein
MVQNQLRRIEKIIKESAAYEIEQVILSVGMKQSQETYARLKNSNQQSKYFDENEFVNMGYRFLSMGKLTEAIEIFKMAVEQFPQSFNTWDCLGEAYLKSGNKELAIKNYKKSLELNPKNDNAKNMLEQLHK